MSKIRLVGISVVVFVTAAATLARAEDISAKKLFIKDNATNPAKRQVQVQSSDLGVQFSEAGDPGTNGAALHLYSATDDFCVILPPGAGWKNKNGKWTYKNNVTKNSAQIKNDKLAVKIKSGVTFTLTDNLTQGTVNAQVQFGSGTRYCMRCTGNKKDEATKFLGKGCVAAPCDAEPSSCDPPIATTTTSTTGPTTTTSTTMPPPGVVLKGALTATPGRFNYNLMVGLPGANAACNTNFPGTHACTYPELQSAETAGDLDGLKDTANNTVTAFWVIDASPTPSLTQCLDDVSSNLNWEYGTAHTASRGTRVDLNNPAGTLGAVQAPQQCNFSSFWVGCCQ